ncbi:C39 family peptidase [Salinisphaera hydrothermalis]|uniref:C39 family peptidase n=1 Tax=Salinisphaera hydrothermalis TaxID=563188 RepID=UPI0033422169
MRPFSTCKCSKAALRRLALLAMVPLGLAAPGAIAGTVWLSEIATGVGNVPVRSMQALRFARTVHQQFDYSCGSAAVATLLSYQYGDPISEQAVFSAMWQNGDQTKIRREGFSLLDMKRYLDAHGFQANGYDAPLSKLAEVGVPAIVLVSEHGYNHFVVVKGLSGGRALVGDPSMGARTLPIERFRKTMRSPILFVVTNHRQEAVFNGRADWSNQPLAPLGQALDISNLALTRVLTPGAIQF